MSELKTLDPCCGSGHFLVTAFLMLVPMRMECDGLSARDAVDAVLRENIHGLELDKRCVELAAFALALTAWKYPKAGGYRPLPVLNVACSGLAISAKKEDWLALAGDNTNLRLTLVELYKQFKDAPVLGSLINPETSLSNGSLFELKWEEVGPLLTKALSDEKDNEKNEMRVVAQGIAKSALLLVSKYHLVATNVPYLSQGKQEIHLTQFAKQKYPNSKADLATIFVERCMELAEIGGCAALVTPHNWHYLASYKNLRNSILKSKHFSFVASLGDKAFSTALWDFGIALNLMKKNLKSSAITSFLRLKSQTPYTSISSYLVIQNIDRIDQLSLQKSDSSRIMLVEVGRVLLQEYCYTYKGICAGDSDHFVNKFWEHELNNKIWSLMQGSYSTTCFFDGRDAVFKWENGDGDYMDYVTERLGDSISAWVRGREAWNKNGIVVRVMGNLPCVLYGGQIYNNNVSTIIPKSGSYLSAIWAFCSSEIFNDEVRKINQKPSITDNSFIKIPFDLDHWTKVAEEKCPNGLPKPYSNDPTQWIFHGNPAPSNMPLQVAGARLLGYRWPAELDASIELADEQREWVKRCEALLPCADDDGIVCIPPVRGEASAADRLLNLMAAAYGEAWSNDIQAQLLKNTDHAGKTLETWLREKFFTQHCKLFQHCPFIWHIWDGLRDGFAALVNYHKLDAKLLETLIFTYLGDWISRQKQDITKGVDDAQEKLSAAESLQKKLELILEGEAPFDIFVRWKPIEMQPIGWNPDLNDGVRLNIRPFMTVGDVKKRGAGVLRDKPNIKWGKDRGKDVASAPWFSVFGGDRINDHHLTLEEKRQARQRRTRERELMYEKKRHHDSDRRR